MQDLLQEKPRAFVLRMIEERFRFVDFENLSVGHENYPVRDLPRIWRRLLFLGDRLRVPRHTGDTPAEFGGRLAASVPDLDDDVKRLAKLYTRANFRRGGLSADELGDARQAWSRIRRDYVGLVAKAWRDAWAQGRVVSEEEAAASKSREP